MAAAGNSAHCVQAPIVPVLASCGQLVGLFNYALDGRRRAQVVVYMIKTL